MVQKGKRKFICQDCREVTFFTVKELHKASAPTCRWCGSLSIEPSRGSLANEEILQASTNRISKEVKESNSIAVDPKIK
jgi:hypothetical protein